MSTERNNNLTSTTNNIVGSTDTKPQTLTEKINDLEESYKELNDRVNSSKEKYHDDEHNLLECLKKLMPMHNSYYVSIIKTLQTQLEQKNNNSPKELPTDTNSVGSVD
jgi:hypothetical protein